MCGKTPKQPPKDPREVEALLRQTTIAEEAFAYSKEADQFNRQRQAKLDEQNEALTAELMGRQRTLNSRADESYDRYMTVGRQLEDSAISDAYSVDSEGAMLAAQAKAKSDVEQAFGAQRQSAMRNMQRMGVNPASGRYMSAMADGGANAALATVDAGNKAVEGRRAMGMQARAGLAGSLAPSYLNASMGLGAQSTSTALSGAGLGMQGFSTALASQGAFNSGMQGAGGLMGSVAQGYGNIHQRDMAGWKAKVDANAAKWGALGSAAGSAAGIYAGMQ